MRIISKKTTKKSTKNTLMKIEEDSNRSMHLKKVLFLKATVHNVDSVPEDERENLWYTSADLDVAFDNEVSLRKCISTNKHVYRKNQDYLNSQGIFSEEQAMKKDSAVEASLSAVFDEQKKQKAAFLSAKKDGKLVLNNDKIAEAYQSHSQEAMEQALRRAKHVQDEAEDAVVPLASSPFSKTRFLKKASASSPTKSKKSSWNPTVFMPEGSQSRSRKITKLATPAA